MTRWIVAGTLVNRGDGGGVPVPEARGGVRRVTWETSRVLSTAVTVLAHQGGWDEILMVLTPIAVFALLLKLANDRANRLRDARDVAAADHEPVDERTPDRDI